MFRLSSQPSRVGLNSISQGWFSCREAAPVASGSACRWRQLGATTAARLCVLRGIGKLGNRERLRNPICWQVLQAGITTFEGCRGIHLPCSWSRRRTARHGRQNNAGSHRSQGILATNTRRFRAYRKWRLRSWTHRHRADHPQRWRKCLLQCGTMSNCHPRNPQLALASVLRIVHRTAPLGSTNSPTQQRSDHRRAGG